MKNESGSPVTKPGGSFFQKVVLRGEASCLQTGVRRAVVCIQCGSVQSFSGDVGTKGDREAEQWGWPQRKRRAKAR